MGKDEKQALKEFEEMKKAWENQFEPRMITDNVELYFEEDADGHKYAQIRIIDKSSND